MPYIGILMNMLVPSMISNCSLSFLFMNVCEFSVVTSLLALYSRFFNSFYVLSKSY